MGITVTMPGTIIVPRTSRKRNPSARELHLGERIPGHRVHDRPARDPDQRNHGRVEEPAADVGIERRAVGGRASAASGQNMLPNESWAASGLVFSDVATLKANGTNISSATKTRTAKATDLHDPLRRRLRSTHRSRCPVVRSFQA